MARRRIEGWFSILVLGLVLLLAVLALGLWLPRVLQDLFAAAAHLVTGT